MTPCVFVQYQSAIASVPRKHSLWLKALCCDFPCEFFFLVQPLVKEHLLEGGVQALLRHRSPIPAPVMCLGVLLHELDARGEGMLANQFTFSLKKTLYPIYLLF